MYKIGLTGGVASGKSTVAAILRKLGAPVIDADTISRELTAPGGAALPAIRERFGDTMFEGDKLNRRALGSLIFTDREARRALEAIVHPLVYGGINEQIRELAAREETAVILEIPLLFETGYDTQVDEIWLTLAPRREQLRRLMVRNSLTEAEALARIDSQWPPEQKERFVRVRIDTSMPPGDVAANVQAAWQASTKRAQKGGVP